MKKAFLICILLFTSTIVSAQNLEPTEEEIKKYGPVLQDIFKETGLNISMGNLPSNKAVSRFDSLYFTDPNSLFLAGLLMELNLRLIYDSLKTERVPNTINTLHKIIRLTKEKYTKNTYFTLAGLCKKDGEYEAAIDYLQRSLKLEKDTQFRISILNNLASTYNSAGEYKKSLNTIRQIANQKQVSNTRGGLLSEIYYNNNMYDSAIYFANKSLKQKSPHYSAYIYKAKSLIKKGDTKEICNLITKSKAIIDEKNFEAILAQRDQNNPYIKEFLFDIKEIKELKIKYCN